MAGDDKTLTRGDARALYAIVAASAFVVAAHVRIEVKVGALESRVEKQDRVLSRLDRTTARIAGKLGVPESSSDDDR